MLKTLPIYFVIGVYHYVRVCIALSYIYRAIDTAKGVVARICGRTQVLHGERTFIFLREETFKQCT
jgi:hypothetical protein